MIVNPILQKLHVLGFTQVQRPVISPQVVGRISRFATDNAGSMDPSYGSRLSHPFQGRTSPNASSSTLSLLKGADNTIARGGSFSAGERYGGGGRHSTLSAGGFTQPSF